MRTTLIHIALILVSVRGFAQKAELKQRCHKLMSQIEGDAPFHLQYTITVQGKGEKPEEGSIKMNLYKNGSDEEFIMGDIQEVMHKNKILFLINHSQKSILVKTDTSTNDKSNILTELDKFVDSSTTITSSKKGGLIKYALSYGESYMYKRAELVFSSSTGKLTTIYAEFAANYPEQYNSMKVEYQLWDTSWKPEADFPNYTKYIVMSGTTYRTQDNYKNYKIIQPQQGTQKY